MKLAKKIRIVTLGCSKNVVDSEFLAGQLQNLNVTVEHEDKIKEPNIVIINTCGFINDAKEESINEILQYVSLKKQGIIETIIVTGCLIERYKEELKKEIPEVDYFCGVNQITEIVQFIDKHYIASPIKNRLISTPSHYAYLKIAEGCNRKCSFCAIPQIRGKYISKTIDELYEESLLLADKGVKELILIAQDLTYFGWDRKNKHELVKLIQKLSEIEQIEWIRLHYAYPIGFTDELIEEINQNKKICKYIDIPIQHINDHLLKSMQRGHTKDDLIKLLEKIRKNIQNVAIRTSVIVGYPGETEKRFQELYDFISDFQFDRLGVFTYSDEENTKAFDLKGKISEKEKQNRKDLITLKQQAIALQKNAQMVGKQLKVLIDRIEGYYYIGRTEFDSPEIDQEVLIAKDNNNIKVGAFYTITIKDYEEFDLIGSGKWVKI